MIAKTEYLRGSGAARMNPVPGAGETDACPLTLGSSAGAVLNEAERRPSVSLSMNVTRRPPLCTDSVKVDKCSSSAVTVLDTKAGFDRSVPRMELSCVGQYVSRQMSHLSSYLVCRALKLTDRCGAERPTLPFCTYFSVDIELVVLRGSTTA